MKLSVKFELKKCFDGPILINDKTIMCHISNKKILFYKMDKSKIQKKIQERLDEEYLERLPDLFRVREMCKRINNVQNSYDGIILLSN